MSFLVWNPAAGMPTRAHDSLESAYREAVRLRGANPGQTFYVMAPIITDAEIRDAKAFSDGKAEGLRDSHRQIMLAEGRTDALLDERRELRLKLRRVETWLSRAPRFQSIVADALLWFDGFSAAFARRDDWERPSVPSRDTLRELNSALLDLRGQDASLDDDIPF